MWTALKQTLIALLSSKKAVTAIISAVAAGLMRLGFAVDANTVGLVLTPLVGLIVSQGVADHGKTKPLPEATP